MVDSKQRTHGGHNTYLEHQMLFFSSNSKTKFQLPLVLNINVHCSVVSSQITHKQSKEANNLLVANKEADSLVPLHVIDKASLCAEPCSIVQNLHHQMKQTKKCCVRTTSGVVAKVKKRLTEG
jgi:hypothetical protein